MTCHAGCRDLAGWFLNRPGITQLLGFQLHEYEFCSPNGGSLRLGLNGFSASPEALPRMREMDRHGYVILTMQSWRRGRPFVPVSGEDAAHEEEDPVEKTFVVIIFVILLLLILSLTRDRLGKGSGG